MHEECVNDGRHINVQVGHRWFLPSADSAQRRQRTARGPLSAQEGKLPIPKDLNELLMRIYK